MAKTIIYYHRAYRKITGSGWRFFMELAVISLLLSVLICLGFPYITELMSRLAQAVLSNHYTADEITIIAKAFLWQDVYLVNLTGYAPSTSFAIINALVSAGLVVLLKFVKKRKNIAIYFIFLLCIHLVSSLFFIFFSSWFPYTATAFSELYIKAQISMWIFIPIILSMAFLPLPAPMPHKVLLIGVTMVYSIVFSTLRYIVFLFIISKLSTIYMAVLFFALGPLIDFIYIVGIYCFYSSKLANDLKGNPSLWKWLY